MMKCDEYREILSEVEDAQTSKSKRRIAKLHFEKCQSCRMWLIKHQEFEKHLTKNIDNIFSQIEMPIDLFSKVKYKMPKTVEDSSERYHSRKSFFKQLKFLIPQMAFNFMSILISILLLHDVICGLLEKL